MASVTSLWVLASSMSRRRDWSSMRVASSVVEGDVDVVVMGVLAFLYFYGAT